MDIRSINEISAKKKKGKPTYNSVVFTASRFVPRKFKVLAVFITVYLLFSLVCDLFSLIKIIIKL